MAAGAALSAKRGETKKSELKGASKSMVKSMSEKELEDLAKTKRKSLPTTKTPPAAKSKGGAKPKSASKPAKAGRKKSS